MAEEKDIAIKVSVDTAGAGQSLGELKSKAKELRDQIENTPIGSAKFKQLSAEIKKTEGAVGHLEQELKSLNPEQAADGFLKAGEAIAGSFAVAQGAMALFGSQSEEVEKALLKVEAAIAILQGFKAITEGLSKAGAAFDALKTVIEKNPIFTIAVVIGAITTAIYAMAESTDVATEANRELASSIESLNADFDQYEKALGEQQKKIKERYDLEVREAAATGKSVSDIQKKSLAEQEELIKGQQDKANELNEGLKKQILVEEYQLKRIQAKRAQEGALARVDLIEREKELIKSIGLKEEAIKKTIALDEKGNQELKKLSVDRLEVQKAENDKSRQLSNDRIAQRQKEADIPLVDPKKTQQLAVIKDEAVAVENSFADASTYVFERMERDIDVATSRINQFFDKISVGSGFALSQVGQNLNTVSDIFEASQNRQLAAAKGNEAKQEAIRKKFFERQKKVQIVQAVISTYQGAVNAFTQTAASPITAVFPAAPYIAAASALAAGFANIAKIKSQSYEGGGGDSGGGGGASGPEIPSPPTNGGQPSFGSTVLDQNAIDNNQSQAPIKVFVTESDITQSQKNVNSIQNKAVIE